MNPRIDPRCEAKKHGDFVAYTNWGCRCFQAKVSWSNFKSDRNRGVYVSRKVDATGARRRIEALACLGWTYGDIGRRINVGRNAIAAILGRDTIYRSTADRIAEVFEQLSATVAPPSYGASRSMEKAKRCGYAPPLAWDDIDNPSERPKHKMVRWKRHQ